MNSLALNRMIPGILRIRMMILMKGVKLSKVVDKIKETRLKNTSASAKNGPQATDKFSINMQSM